MIPHCLLALLLTILMTNARAEGAAAESPNAERASISSEANPQRAAGTAAEQAERHLSTTLDSAPSVERIALRLESDSDGSRSLSVTELLKALAALIAAVAWPAVFITLLVTQRRGLRRVFAELAALLGKSQRVKVGNLIEIEVDRSAKEATTATDPEIPSPQLQAAARVERLVSDVDLPEVRGRMLELATEYDTTRSSLSPGAQRTLALNRVVAKMRALAIAAKPFLHEFSVNETSAGVRLAAIAILQLSPTPEYVPWLVQRMSREQPFVLFHASVALLSAVRAFGARSAPMLRVAIEEALQTVTSFKSGRPDPNTVQTLERALGELPREAG